MTDNDMPFELHFEEHGRCGRFAGVAGLCGELDIMAGGETHDLIRLEDGEIEGELLHWATERYEWKCAEFGNAEIVLLDRRGESLNMPSQQWASTHKPSATWPRHANRASRPRAWFISKAYPSHQGGAVQPPRRA